MRYLFGLIYLFVVQKWDAFDRWLCFKLPWPLRLSWCTLWVREDEFHPSLNSDGMGLLNKTTFLKKWHRLWMDITRLRPIPTKEDIAKENMRLKKFEDRMHTEYYENLVRRRVIAHRRTDTPSLS